ncbi:MAG: type II secretion system F family protein [Actinomyces sp.]|uniref:type II secretion system F family protein n=1 Tax=Actinomyces sp. TaxID=29317 RepID=UPI0026DCD492|nr:type II secretion system F family protein [Actinomyces sp.]MDO4242965.1 type II secretion system F family protein [Actinomyces sp.]
MITSGAVLLVAAATTIVASLAIVTLGAASWRSTAIADSVGATSGGGAGRVLARLDRVLGTLGVTRAVAKRLSGAGLSWSPVKVIVIVVAIDVVLFVVIRTLVGNIGALVIAASFPVIFFRWVHTKVVQRTERFIAQLPELARLLANATSAGLSLERALLLAAREMPEPAASELARVTAQIGVGWTFDAALNDLSERMPSRELNVLVRTLLIQSRTGGGLVGALQDIALSLDERKELRREVRTVILGSAISGYIVPVLGIGSVLFLNLMEPGILDEMMRSFIGQMIIFPSVLLFGLGALLMRAVSRVEV